MQLKHHLFVYKLQINRIEKVPVYLIETSSGKLELTQDSEFEWNEPATSKNRAGGATTESPEVKSRTCIFCTDFGSTERN
jgi:hypothetical protein